jgi:predicted permease
MDFLTSLTSVGLLILLALPGYILRKTSKLADTIVDGLAVILLYVSCPLLMVEAFAKTSFSREILYNMGLVVFLGLILLTGAYFISRLCFRGFKEDAAKRAYIASGYMSNSAFMGIPIIQIFFPGSSEALIYISTFAVPFNILAWTLLVFTITRDKKYISLKAALYNPGTISVLIAMSFMIFKIQIPDILLRPISLMGGITTPLAMFIVGIRLANIKFHEIFTSYKIYLSSLVKLILAPLFSLGIILCVKLIIPVPSTAALTLYIAMAMPSASFVIVFSEKFGGDYLAAVKCVLLSSFLSIATIPLVMLASNLL